MSQPQMVKLQAQVRAMTIRMQVLENTLNNVIKDNIDAHTAKMVLQEVITAKDAEIKTFQHQRDELVAKLDKLTSDVDSNPTDTTLTE